MHLKNHKRAESQKGIDGELGKITQSKDVSIETEAKIVHTLILPITMHGCEIWAVKKTDRKNK